MFLTLTDLSVATFNETRAPTSRKNVAKQGTVMPNWSKTFQIFWLHFSVFYDQRDLNISDQYEALIPSSSIYFLGMRVQLLQKLATRKKTP